MTRKESTYWICGSEVYYEKFDGIARGSSFIGPRGDFDGAWCKGSWAGTVVNLKREGTAERRDFDSKGAVVYNFRAEVGPCKIRVLVIIRAPLEMTKETIIGTLMDVRWYRVTKQTYDTAHLEISLFPGEDEEAMVPFIAYGKVAESFERDHLHNDDDPMALFVALQETAGTPGDASWAGDDYVVLRPNEERFRMLMDGPEPHERTWVFLRAEAAAGRLPKYAILETPRCVFWINWDNVQAQRPGMLWYPTCMWAQDVFHDTINGTRIEFTEGMKVRGRWPPAAAEKATLAAFAEFASGPWTSSPLPVGKIPEITKSGPGAFLFYLGGRVIRVRAPLNTPRSELRRFLTETHWYRVYGRGMEADLADREAYLESPEYIRSRLVQLDREVTREDVGDE